MATIDDSARPSELRRTTLTIDRNGMPAIPRPVCAFCAELDDSNSLLVSIMSGENAVDKCNELDVQPVETLSERVNYWLLETRYFDRHHPIWSACTAEAAVRIADWINRASA